MKESIKDFHAEFYCVTNNIKGSKGQGTSTPYLSRCFILHVFMHNVIGILVLRMFMSASTGYFNICESFFFGQDFGLLHSRQKCLLSSFPLAPHAGSVHPLTGYHLLYGNEFWDISSPQLLFLVHSS